MSDYAAQTIGREERRIEREQREAAVELVRAELAVLREVVEATVDGIEFEDFHGLQGAVNALHGAARSIYRRAFDLNFALVQLEQITVEQRKRGEDR